MADYKKGRTMHGERHLCGWGNAVASEVLTEARLLLVENYFQSPYSVWVRLFLKGLP